jgi:hypothetical protein
MPDGNDGKHLKLWASATYHIEVEGVVSEYWSTHFGDMRISTRTRKDNSIVTILVGRVKDQAELSGLLNSLYDYHLPLLSVDLLPENNETHKKEERP